MSSSASSSLKTSLNVLGVGLLTTAFILTTGHSVKADPLERGVQGAVGGAIIGGILNGGRGAGRGAAIGGAVGIIGGAIEDSERRGYRDDRGDYYEEEVYEDDTAYGDEGADDDDYDAPRSRSSQPKKAAVSKPKKSDDFNDQPKAAKSEPQKSELVREIQAQLTKLGYNPGKADGVMGAATVEAIAAYETENGLPVTRQPTETLLQHMKKGKS